MNFITKVRVKLGWYFLRKDLSRFRRDLRASNLSDARDIGILFSMGSEADYDRVSRFANELNLVGKKVQIIGYFQFNKLPPYYAQKLSYDLILPKDLDFFMRPKADFVKKFISCEFDMLIDLSTRDEFPLHYIASLSRAKFKLGQTSGEPGMPYDLMIDSGEQMDGDTLIRQMVHYTSAFKIS